MHLQIDTTLFKGYLPCALRHALLTVLYKAILEHFARHYVKTSEMAKEVYCLYIKERKTQLPSWVECLLCNF